LELNHLLLKLQGKEYLVDLGELNINLCKDSLQALKTHLNILWACVEKGPLQETVQ